MGNDSAEFIALGTAVKAEDGTSYLNTLGQALHLGPLRAGLLDAHADGYVPQGLVMGTCVFHIAHRKLTQALGSMGQNVELPNFTQALYEARELAMTRMQDEATSSRRAASSACASRRSRTSGARTPSSSCRSARR